MMIQPHGFSKSPVEMVMCSFKIEGRDEDQRITIPAPYPGWSLIQSKIADISGTLPGERSFFGIKLEYHDRFSLTEENDNTNLFTLSLSIPEELEKRMISGPKIHLTFNSVLPHSVMSIVFSRQSNREIIMYFLVKTDETAIYTRKELIDWFDRAHEEIHILFDSLVTQDLVSKLT